MFAEMTEAPKLICSAKGCRSTASWQLRWNNPRLHPPERRKTWLACDAHRGHLGDFLDARGFLREVVALGEGAPADPTGPVGIDRSDTLPG